MSDPNERLPETTTTIRDEEGGRVVERPARPGEAEDLRQAGQGWRVSERETGALRAQQREDLLQDLGVDSPLNALGVGAMGVVDGALGFGPNAGAASVAARFLPEITQEFIRESQNRNPLAMYGGGALGAGAAAVLSGGAGAVGLAGRVGQLARLTPAGMATIFGENLAQGVRSGLMARGIAPNLARSVGIISGAAAEGLGDDSIEVMRRFIEDPSRSGEELMAGFGLGGTIGLGIGTTFAGAGTLRRALRGRARALASSLPDDAPGRLALQQDLAETGGLGQFQSVRDTDFRPSWVTRARARVSETLGFGNYDDIVDMANPAFQQRFVEATDGLPRALERLETNLNGLSETTAELFQGEAQRTARLRQALQGVDVATLQDDVLDMLGMQESGLGSALNSPIEGLSRIGNRYQRTFQSAMDLVEEARTPEQVVDALEQLRTSVMDISAAPVPRSSATASGAIQEFQRSIGEANERAITGIMDNLGPDVGAIRNLRQVERQYSAQRRQVLQRLGIDVAEDGTISRNITADRLRRAVGEVAREGNGSSLRRQLDDYLQLGEQYRAAHRNLFGQDIDSADAILAMERQIYDDFAKASEWAESLNMMQNATLAEAQRRGAGVAGGAAQVAGSLTGIVGGAVAGGTLGEGDLSSIALGAAMGLGAASVVRPMSYAAQAATMRASFDRVRSIRERAFGDLRRSLTTSGGGPRMTTTGGQGTRGVPLAVNRLRNAESRREEYEQYREEVRALAANPAMFNSRLDHMVGSVGEVSDEILAEVGLSGMRAVQYLNDHLPPQEINPFGRQRPPSQALIDDFLRRVAAIENPYSIVEDAAAGRVNRVSVQTVQYVYPRLYAQIVESTSNILGDIGELPTYQSRVAVSQLLQMPLDPTLEPSFINEMQSLRQQSQASAQANGTTTRMARNVAFRSGDNLYSSSQEISQSL
jgi:hypothetical protein